MMQREIYLKLYEKPELIEYLRYNPEWYKILYYEPNRFNDFLNEAKERLKITLNDRINLFRNQVDFFKSLMEYINK